MHTTLQLRSLIKVRNCLSPSERSYIIQSNKAWGFKISLIWTKQKKVFWSKIYSEEKSRWGREEQRSKLELMGLLSSRSSILLSILSLWMVLFLFIYIYIYFIVHYYFEGMNFSPFSCRTWFGGCWAVESVVIWWVGVGQACETLRRSEISEVCWWCGSCNIQLSDSDYFIH